MEMRAERLEQSFLQKASPFVMPLALFGIPAAGWVALVLCVQIPRSLYGQANPFLALGEIGSLMTVLVLFLFLRACLDSPAAPKGFYRDVLDFLALKDWHPAVIIAFLGLLVLPAAWYLHSSVLIWDIRIRGSRALQSVDVQAGLDSIAVAYQLGLTAGVPMLCVMHLLSRWKPKRRAMLWLLVPLLLLGTAVGAVVVGVLLHEPS
jgi:hypothetical protein